MAGVDAGGVVVAGAAAAPVVAALFINVCFGSVADGLALSTAPGKFKEDPAIIKLGFFIVGFSFKRSCTVVLFFVANPDNVSPR